MSPKFILMFLILLSVIFEATFVAFPFVFILSILLYILYPEKKSVATAFIAGLLIDIFKLTPVGITPAIILFSFVGLDVIRNAFEIKDYKIILAILFVSSFAYAKYFSYTDNLLIYILVFGGAFIFLSYFYKKELGFNK